MRLFIIHRSIRNSPSEENLCGLHHISITTQFHDHHDYHVHVEIENDEDDDDDYDYYFDDIVGGVCLSVCGGNNNSLQLFSILVYNCVNGTVVDENMLLRSGFWNHH